MTLVNREAELTRVNIDIADYKRQRADHIAEQAETWIKEVRETGKAKTLDLNAVDRRTVHKLAEDYSDITTHSEGEGPGRRLIIAKK
jgi:spoIIIJ-associated protein